MYRQNDKAFIFQTPVYIHARNLIISLKLKSVLDVGCGNPQKLKAYIYPFIVNRDNIVGLDLIEVVDEIKETFGEWIRTDLDADSISLERTFELIIVADVIEHLKNPTMMFDTIKRHVDKDTLILISTPDGLSISPMFSNESHEKEYSGQEMTELIEKNGLSIEWSSSYVERNAKPEYTNNVFVCKMKGDKDGK